MTYYRRPNIEKGTNRDDVINGTNRTDIVFAKNGDDIINTGGGDDIIYAGNGDDVIHAGSGNDLVFAGNGDDVVFAGSGWDKVYGGNGNDTVFGGSGQDLIFGDRGDDQLFGESGSDIIFGGKGDDFLSGGTGNDILVGGSGCDTAVFEDSIFNFWFFDLGFFGFYVVHDGALGVDALFGIEKLQFDDFTVFIDGRNNAPFAFDDEAATDADMVLTILSDQLLNNDFDFDGDDLTIVSVDDTNTLGIVTLNAVGEVVYDANGQFDFLNVGETATDTFEYTVSDGNGGFETALVTVTVTGVNNNNNNAPDAVDDMATTDEDTAVDIDVLDNDLDIDNDILTIVQVDGQAISDGQSVTIASGAIVTLTGGILNYDPAGQFEALGVGGSTTDSFTYTISDGNGGSDTATVSVNIDGVNDAPVAVNDSFQLTEDDGSVGGNVLDNDTDVDNGDVLTVTEVNGQAPGTALSVVSDGGRTSGGVVIEADGTFTFVNNVTSDPVAFQDLAAGESDTVTLNYTITDGNGGTDTATVTITIKGVNDAPVAVDDINAAADDGVTVDGNVLDNDNDIDASDVLSVANAGSFIGVYGTLTLNGDGTYSYVVTDESIDDGFTDVDTFSVDVTDGIATVTSTLTINITGLNDAPVAVDDTNAAADDGVAVTGNVLDNDSDVDAGDTLTVANAGTLTGTFGTLTLNTDGSYSYVVTDESIDDGFTGVDSFSIDVTDGTETVASTLNIDITGLNDAPVAVDDTNDAADDGVAVTGNVQDNDSDVDAGDTLTVANAGTLIGAFGTLTLNTDGSYSYIVTDESIDDGFTGVDSFSIDVTDGTDRVTSTLNINITGLNDAPVVVDDTNAAADDGVAVNGNVLDNDSDVDAGDILSVANAGSFTGVYGTLTLNGDGTYSYIVTDESIDDGFMDVDTFSVDVTDGTATVTSTLTIDITGLNDAPVVVDDINAAADDGVAVNGNVLDNDSDVDAGDVLSVANAGSFMGVYGTLTLNSNGTYSYIVTDESIDDGFTDVDTFSIDVTDGTATVTSTLTINITGLNDAPVAADDTNAAADDGVAVTGNVLDNDNDVDAGDVLSVANAGTLIGTFGTLTLNSDGTYSYVVTDESIDDGFTGVDSFSIEVTDGTDTVTSALDIDITGLNDAPVAVDDSDDASDDGIAVTGNVLDNDIEVDALDELTVANAGTFVGVYGTLTLNADGTYSYVVTDESIPEGFTDVDTFSVDVTDGTGTDTSTLTINITGLNDDPDAMDDMFTIGESQSASGNLLNNDVDVDNGDVLSVTDIDGNGPGSFTVTSVGGRTGTVTFAADGTFTFSTDGNFEDLNAGESDVVQLTYSITDDALTAGTDSAQITITINGENDNVAPDAVDDIAATDEDTAIIIRVLDNDTDANGDALTVVQVDGQNISVGGSVTLTASGATVTLNGDGTLTYDPSGVFDFLAQDDVTSDLFSYTISDGELTDTAFVDVEITGVNDAPVAADQTLNVFEGIGITISSVGNGDFFFNAFDVDGVIDSVFQVDGIMDGATGITTAFGTLTWDPANGLFTYTVNDANPTVHNLLSGESLVDTFSFSLLDDFGAESNSATLTVTIDGVNDGLFTEQSDGVNLSAAVEAFPETAFENNFLDALGGDDFVILVSGNENSLYLDEFDGQTFNGNGGDDTISVLNGFMNADGSTGSDTIDFSLLLNPNGGVSLDLAVGDVDLNRNNSVDLTAVNFENIFGSTGNDLFTNSTAANIINGSDGTDTINVAFGTSSLIDTYIGGAGNDTLINNSGTNLSFNEFVTTDLTGTINGSGIESVHIDGVSILGTSGDNNFDFTGVQFREVGTANTFLVVSSGDGNDTVVGTDTSGVLTNSAGTGIFRYDLGDGNDTFAGNGSIVDVVFGGLGNDTIFGGNSNDLLEGGAGADFINGEAGTDRIFIRAGDNSELDTLIGGGGSDTIDNQSGGDFAFGIFDATDASETINGSGIETIELSGRTLLGTANDNFFNFTGVQFREVSTNQAVLQVSTGDGNDVVVGSNQTGVLTNSAGTASFRYDLGAGNDRFTGNGNILDVVSGGAGMDELNGGDGADTLNGDADDDILFGEGGNDTLDGGLGIDRVDGGAGNDTILLGAGSAHEQEIYIGGDNVDTLDNQTGGNFWLNLINATSAGVTNVLEIERIDLTGFTLMGTPGDNIFDFTGVQFVGVNTSASVLTVATGFGNDTVVGSDTSGVLTNLAGTSTFRYDLGEGNDSFTGNGSIVDIVFGGAGDDTILGGGANDQLEGGAGADFINGQDGTDRIFVRANDDSDLDTLIGGGGTDTIDNQTGGDFAFGVFDATDLTETVNGSGIETLQLQGSTLLGTPADNAFNFTGVQFQGVSTNVNVLQVSTGGGNDTVVGSDRSGVLTNSAGTSTFRYDLGDGNDTFTGNGNILDVVSAGSGMDVLSGGDGGDTFDGGADDDILFGEGGADTLDGGLGVDRVEGGAGNDTILLSAGSAHETEVYIGGDNVDTIDNRTGADFTLNLINATSGGVTNVLEIERIDLTTFTLLGTSGDNIFDFRGVQFVGVNTSGSVLTVSTGDGNDTVFGSDTAGVLSNSAGTSIFRYDLGEGNDTFTGSGNIVDIVFGGAGNDTILGGDAADRLEGGAGADFINGEGGNDTFFVRAGDNSDSDTLIGGASSDTIDNQSGGDFAFSVFDATDATETVNGSGIETLNLRGATLLGTAGNNAFNFTGTQFQGVSLNAAVLQVSTGAGNDDVVGTNLNGVLTNSAGTSSFRYNLGEGDDSFVGNGTIQDVVSAGAGMDTLNGGNGNDIFDGGADDDMLFGEGGNDVLDGGLGVDVVDGGAGNDTILLGAGSNHENEVYIGGDGTNDEIENQTGADFTLNLINATSGGVTNVDEVEAVDLAGFTLLGTTGDDIFDFTGVQFRAVNLSASVLTVSAGDGNDVVTGSNINGVLTNSAGTSVFRYALGAGDDSFIGDGNIMDVVTGGSGSDTILGGSGSDRLEGGADADFVNGEGGNDTIFVRAGDNSELDTLVGGAGSDRIDNQSGGDFAFGVFDATDLTGTVNGSEVEIVDLNGSMLLGTVADNTFDFTGVQFQGINLVPSAQVSTGDGNDTVTGTGTNGVFTNSAGTGIIRYDLGDGDDTFTGTGTISDIITGGAGNDILTGAGGNDVFIFEDGFGNDTITDFNATNNAEDIDLSGVTEITDFADLDNNHLTQDGADALISDGLGNTVRLLNVNVNDLDAADFIF